MTGKQSESQLEKFREAVRELETDDDEKRFDERLGKLAKVSAAKESPVNVQKRDK